MENILQTAISVTGGLTKWKSYSLATAQIRTSGLWAEGGDQQTATGFRFIAALGQQSGEFLDYPAPGQRIVFKAGQLAVLTKAGDIFSPGSPAENKNGLLKILNFKSYALWTTLTFPFSVTLKGYQTEETGTHYYDGKTLESLMVTDTTLADYKIIGFFFTPDGLLSKADYEPEALGALPLTQLVYDYREFDGIMIPTKARIYPRNTDGSPFKDTLLLGFDIDSAAFR